MTQKLMLLHLSDIHIKKTSDSILSRASSIASATFPRLPEIHTLALLLSGDVAFSGSAGQYDLATKFVEEIKETIGREAPRVKIEVFVCPGNHDCDFSKHDDTRDAVLAKIRSLDGADPSESLIKTSATVEDAFFAFRDKVSSYKWNHDTRLSWQTALSIAGHRVGFRSLNVAWMSELKEKQGTLVFPPSAVQPFEFDAKTDLAITLLHHPFNWLGQSTYRPFQSAVRRESHLIFTGHEHFQNVLEINDLRSSSSVSIEGGVLFEEDTPDHSTFNMVIVDLSTKQYVTELLSWNGTHYLAQVDDEEWGSLRPLPTKGQVGYVLQADFLKTLNDPGANFSHSAKKDLEIDESPRDSRRLFGLSQTATVVA